MKLSPDEMFFFLNTPYQVNYTIFFSCVVVILTTLGAWLITRKIDSSTNISRGQNLLEVIIGGMCDQIKEVSGQNPRPYLPFVGTLFLYIVISNVLSVVPIFKSPTGSLSTTAALAVCVFFAVPIFGIGSKGLLGYLKNYFEPSFVMLPFNIIGEVSRTLALAVRLFGNMMSGGLIITILLALAPLFVPIVMDALGLLTGVIQAYIFAMLAMVYIAAATDDVEEQEQKSPSAEGAGS